MQGFDSTGNSRVIGRLLRRPAEYWGELARVMVVAAAMLIGGQSAHAQQQQDLSQELQLFNSLPQSQQQAIMQQLGVGGAGGALGMSSLLGGGVGGLGGLSSGAQNP